MEKVESCGIVVVVVVAAFKEGIKMNLNDEPGREIKGYISGVFFFSQFRTAGRHLVFALSILRLKR